jgi:hypothetical protein
MAEICIIKDVVYRDKCQSGATRRRRRINYTGAVPQLELSYQFAKNKHVTKI